MVRALGLVLITVMMAGCGASPIPLRPAPAMLEATAQSSAQADLMRTIRRSVKTQPSKPFPKTQSRSLAAAQWGKVNEFVDKMQQATSPEVFTWLFGSMTGIEMNTLNTIQQWDSPDPAEQKARTIAADTKLAIRPLVKALQRGLSDRAEINRLNLEIHLATYEAIVAIAKL